MAGCIDGHLVFCPPCVNSAVHLLIRSFGLALLLPSFKMRYVWGLKGLKERGGARKREQKGRKGRARSDPERTNRQTDKGKERGKEGGRDSRRCMGAVQFPPKSELKKERQSHSQSVFHACSDLQCQTRGGIKGRQEGTRVDGRTDGQVKERKSGSRSIQSSIDPSFLLDAFFLSFFLSLSLCSCCLSMSTDWLSYPSPCPPSKTNLFMLIHSCSHSFIHILSLSLCTSRCLISFHLISFIDTPIDWFWLPQRQTDKQADRQTEAPLYALERRARGRK